MTTMRRRDSEKEEKAKVVDFSKRTAITKSESGTLDESTLTRSAIKVRTCCSDVLILIDIPDNKQSSI